MFVQFFKSLYKKQPKLFYLFGSFFTLQLLFTALKLEVTPFFLYGMYSEKATPAASFSERRIWVNGKELDPARLWVQEALLLEETTNKYVAIKQNNHIDPVQTRVEHRYPFLTQSFVYPLIKDKIYNPPTAAGAYELWLKQRCSKLLNERVDSISIVENTYQIHQERTSIKPSTSEVIARF